MSNLFSDALANMVTSHLLREAASRRDSAGHNGEYHDRGASALEAQVECFKAGLNRRWPESWKSTVYDIIQREADPEYQEYLRLKKKYKDA